MIIKEGLLVHQEVLGVGGRTQQNRYQVEIINN